MADAGGEALNLATLWLPIVPEMSQLGPKAREAGEKFRREFHEGFRGSGGGSGSGADMGGELGSEVSKGFHEKTAGMFDEMMKSMATKSVAMGNLLAKGVEEGIKVLTDLALKAFEGMVEGAEKAAEAIFKIGENFEEINRQLLIFGGTDTFSEMITGANGFNSTLGKAAESAGEVHTKLLELAALDVFRQLDTDGSNLGEVMGVLNARFGQFVDEIHEGQTATVFHSDALKELARDLTEVGDRMGAIDTGKFASAMQQFGVDGLHAGGVFRVMTHDAKEAGITVSGLTDIMVQAGPALSMLGVDGDSASLGLSKIAALGDPAKQAILGVLNTAKESGKNGQDIRQNLEAAASSLQAYQAIVTDTTGKYTQAQKDQAEANAEQLAMAEGGTRNYAVLIQILPAVIKMLHGVGDAQDRLNQSMQAGKDTSNDPYSQAALDKWLTATENLHSAWMALTNDIKASLAGVGVGVVGLVTGGLDRVKKWFDSNHTAIIKKIEEWGDKLIDYVIPRFKDWANMTVSLAKVVTGALGSVAGAVMDIAAGALIMTGNLQDGLKLFDTANDLGRALSGKNLDNIFQPLHDAISNLNVPDNTQQRLKDQLHDALNPQLPPGSAPVPGSGQPAPTSPGQTETWWVAPGSPPGTLPTAGPNAAAPAPAPGAPAPAPAGPTPHPATTSGYTAPSVHPAVLAGFSLPAPAVGQPGTAHPLAANPIVRMAASALGGLTGMDANSVLKMVGLGQPAQPGKGGTTTSETAPPLNSGTAVADSFSSSPSDVMGPTAPSAAQIGTGHGPGYAGVRSTDAYGRPTDDSGGGATLASSYTSTGQQAQLASVDQPSGPGPARPPAGWQADAYDYIQSRGKALGLSPTEINATEAVAKHESNWQSTGFMGFGPEAKAAGFNLDGNPHGAIDQFLNQYTSRRQQGGALDPNDPTSVSNYIWHTVHRAADPNYGPELLQTMGGSGPARPSQAMTAGYTTGISAGANPASRAMQVPNAPNVEAGLRSMGANAPSPIYATSGPNAYQLPPWLTNMASQFGLTASTYASGGSLHQMGYAADFNAKPGDPQGAAKMDAFADYIKNNLSSQTLQLIHADGNERWGIASGRDVSGSGYYAGDYGGHHDHVHWATDAPVGTGGGSQNAMLAGATYVNPPPTGQPGQATGPAGKTPEQLQAEIDAGDRADALRTAQDAVTTNQELIKTTNDTLTKTTDANKAMHDQLNSMTPQDPRRKDVESQAEMDKVTDDDVAKAKRAHDKAIADEPIIEDKLQLLLDKQALPEKQKTGGDSKGGTEGAADELGKGFLGGIASDLGMGNVLGGKSPDKWAAVQIAGGLFGMIMKHLFPNGFGGGIPGIGGQPGVAAAPDATAPSDGSAGSFPTGTLPDGTGPAPGPGSGGSGSGGSIPPLPLGAAHMPGQGDGSTPGLGPDGKPQGNQPGSDPIPGAPPAPAVPGAGQSPAPAPPASAAARGGGQLPIPSIPHPGADYKNWYPLSDDPYAGSNPFGVNMPNKYDPSNQNNLGPKMMTPSDQLNAYPQGTGPGHVEPPIQFAPGGSPPPSIDDLKRFAANHPGAVLPPRGPNDKVPFTNNPGGIPFGGLGDVKDLPGPNSHAVNQSFTAPANAGQSPNVVPGSGATLAGAFTTQAPQPLQPIGSGNQQAASVTHHYDNSIGSITAHDPQAAVAAVQEVHNSRFYTITGGMPRPSVGV